MTPDDAIDAARELIQVSLLLCAPLLAAAAVAGILTAILQTATQVHEQTISLVARLAAVGVALIVCLPWLLDRLVDYAEQVIAAVPYRL